MEQPSAQSVGREFVRQYYTMLHEAPQYLHRFYSHNSSFVHGGVEKPGEEQTPAIGQAEIHKKIASLAFKDCHAKIRQVDSQASVEGSVVIQVVGELSNNGSVMRRFMQTFVLAPQSPKKYYLHNDIFRYQDEIFHEPLGVGGVEEMGDGYENEFTEDVEPPQSAPMDNTHPGYPEPTAVVAPEPATIPPPASNGDVYDGLSNEVGQEFTSPSAVNDQQAPLAPVPSESHAVHEEEAVVPNDVVQGQQADTEPAPPSPSANQVPTQPVSTAKPTWAAMASRNTPAALGSQTTPVSKPQATIRPEPKADPRTSPSNGALPQRQPRIGSQGGDNSMLGGGMDQGGKQVENGGGGGRNSFGGQDDDINRFQRGNVGPAGSQYPDSHQIFVGNVPHTVSDNELREYFSEYGTVVDIRINHKPSQNLPNFGFVTFDSPDAVKNILNAMPLPKMHGKHRINVEEKKPREELFGNRPRSGTRPPMPSGNNPKSFGRDSYSPRGARGQGAGGSFPYSGGKGRDNSAGGGGYGGGGRGGYNGVGGGGGGGFNSSVRNYTKSGSSDDGRGGPPPQQQR